MGELEGRKPRLRGLPVNLWFQRILLGLGLRTRRNDPDPLCRPHRAQHGIIRSGGKRYIRDSVTAQISYRRITEILSLSIADSGWICGICQQRPQEVCAGIGKSLKHKRRFVCDQWSRIGRSFCGSEEPFQITRMRCKNFALGIAAQTLHDTVEQDIPTLVAKLGLDGVVNSGSHSG